MLRNAADERNANSISSRRRARRFAAFEAAVADLPRPLRILDIGGTVQFWEQRGWAGREDVQITLVNLDTEPSPHANIVSLAGDAGHLAEFPDRSFHVAFSNSVIEHLFTRERQEAMAGEVRRVAEAYWVQTPNFWFPIEPHYLVPGWQWLPEGVRVKILQRRSVGWAGRTPDADQARRVIQETRLMRRGELASMFPGSDLLPERFGGLVKSWTAVAGLPAAGARRA
jgi:hypothetical protein